MIYFTQLIYIKEGEEDTFHEFEDVALPLLEKYNGSLLLRIRPTESQVIERTVDLPYEIHLVSFTTESDFENFKSDKTRSNFLHLKEKAIKSVLLIKGMEC
ncbi:MAG: DUF1330 domain-containing protein [Marivirga sp.]|nr:DUF1330 domain-containing protein [Marivirga sp.]